MSKYFVTERSVRKHFHRLTKKETNKQKPLYPDIYLSVAKKKGEKGVRVKREIYPEGLYIGDSLDLWH